MKVLIAFFVLASFSSTIESKAAIPSLEVYKRKMKKVDYVVCNARL